MPLAQYALEPNKGDAVWYDNTLNTKKWERGTVTGFSRKNGRRVYDVTLEDGRQHWGYGYSFLPGNYPDPNEEAMTQKPNSRLVAWDKLKAQYPAAFVFLRVGDFYETFRNDAECIVVVTNMVLTTTRAFWGAEAPLVPMTSCPYHAVDVYANIVLGMGYTVVLAEADGSIQVRIPAQTGAVSP